MKTLDPSDLKYRPNYDNALDNNDYDVAKGFNYHQGPEWVWPRGFFLRARIIFGVKDNQPILKLKHELQKKLVFLREHMMSSLWQGLPELTNENGAPCRDRYTLTPATRIIVELC